MEQLADRYGFTPDDVRAMTLEDVAGFLTIIRVRGELQADAIDKLNGTNYGHRKT